MVNKLIAEKRLVKEKIKLLKAQSKRDKQIIQKRKKVPGRLKGTKQPKFATAATKLVSAFSPQGALAGAQAVQDSGRGRGRPTGTFKERYLPSGRIVKVPTHIYNKMLSEEKRQRRFALAKQQAKIQQQAEAEQLAMSQDPRFQAADEAFLQGEDPMHEQRLQGIEVRRQQLQQPQMVEQQLEQPQQFQQHATLGGKLRAIMRGNRPEQFNDQFSQPSQGQAPQQMFASRQGFQQSAPMQRQNTINPNLHRLTNPQVNLMSRKSNILQAPNLFGRREVNVVGFGR